MSSQYSVKFLVKQNNYSSNQSASAGIVSAALCACSDMAVTNGPTQAASWMQGAFRKPTQDIRKKFRVICAPNNDLKIKQRLALKRLSWIPVHGSSYGFVKNRNSYDCAQSHLLYWGKQEKGLVFLNMDLENFFHSISESEIRKALAGHGMSDSESDSMIDLCMAKITPSFIGSVVESSLRDAKRFPGRINSDSWISDLDANGNIKLLSPDISRLSIEKGIVPSTLHDIRWGLVDGVGRRTERNIGNLTIRSIRDAVQSRCSESFVSQFPDVMNYIREKSLKDGITYPKMLDNWNKGDDVIVTKFIMEFLMGIPDAKIGGLFLPQGCPTSPVITNLVMKVVDIRLSAMAKAFGAYYTRYADDLTFSWPYFTKGKVVDGLKRCVTEVVGEYGLKPNSRKIKVMGPGQKQDVVGYCVNSGKPTINSKYRKTVHRSINWSLKNSRKDEYERLMGMAGYVGSAHPEEAAKMKEKIQALRFHHEMGRKIIVSTHDEDESSVNTEGDHHQHYAEQYAEEAMYPTRFGI